LFDREFVNSVSIIVYHFSESGLLVVTPSSSGL